jgi:hypothetical protein
MNVPTLQRLKSSGYNLCVLHAVQCADLAALPVVWIFSSNYLTNNLIQWQEDLNAFTSQVPILVSARVNMGFSSPIQLGQRMNVGAGGIGTVISGGIPDTVAFVSTVDQQFTCGTALAAGNQPQPVCAAPLYGNGLQMIAPVLKIFVMFSDQPIGAGTMINAATGEGVIIDYAGVTERAVSFDINTGWDWGRQAWAATVPPLTNIQRLLVQQPPTQLLAELAGLKETLAKARGLGI